MRAARAGLYARPRTAYDAGPTAGPRMRMPQDELEEASVAAAGRGAAAA